MTSEAIGAIRRAGGRVWDLLMIMVAPQAVNPMNLDAKTDLWDDLLTKSSGPLELGVIRPDGHLAARIEWAAQHSLTVTVVQWEINTGQAATTPRAPIGWTSIVHGFRASTTWSPRHGGTYSPRPSALTVTGVLHRAPDNSLGAERTERGLGAWTCERSLKELMWTQAAAYWLNVIGLEQPTYKLDTLDKLERRSHWDTAGLTRHTLTAADVALR